MEDGGAAEHDAAMDHVLHDQVVYYSNRAREYDSSVRAAYHPLTGHEDIIRSALRSFAPRGRVLEIACGTGSWTLELLPFASEVTALDASPQMLQQHRRKIRSAKVRRVQADVFSWSPDRSYDVVFFAFWLSHVPLTHFQRFWSLVARSLNRTGRVFFLDEGKHPFWHEEYLDEDRGIVRRRLIDGSEHRAVKELWDAKDLESKLRELGWDMPVESTGPFYWGTGSAPPDVARDDRVR